MLERVKFETVSLLAKIEVRTQEEIDREEEERRVRLMRALQAQHAEAHSAAAARPGSWPRLRRGRGCRRPWAPAGAAAAAPAAARRPSRAGTFVRGERKVGRNEPCPCGSGKKYKHCHGALSSVE